MNYEVNTEKSLFTNLIEGAKQGADLGKICSDYVCSNVKKLGGSGLDTINASKVGTYETTIQQLTANVIAEQMRADALEKDCNKLRELLRRLD